MDEDDRYDVTFHMKEKRWFGGGVHATFGGENNATMVYIYVDIINKEEIINLYRSANTYN